jgi:glycosyltransferase domain-containing protein
MMGTEVILNTELSRLTIIVPTYNRPGRVRRACRYWGSIGQKTIIMDGSAEPLPDNFFKDIPECIDYRHRPVLMAARLEEAIGAICTPYVALCGDDEFHLPSGLAASIRALDEDPKAVAAMGQCLGFLKDRWGSIRVFNRYPNMDGVQISSSISRDRVIAQMRHYAPRSIYGVVRREVWHAAMHPFMRHEWSIYAIAELQFELLVAMAGRTRILPVLHWLRSHEVVEGHSGNDPSLSRNVLIQDRWVDASFRTSFCTATARAWCAIAGGDEREVSTDVTAGLDAYVGYFLPELEKRSLLSRVAKKIAKRRLKLSRMVAKLEGKGTDVPHSELALALRMIELFPDP